MARTGRFGSLPGKSPDLTSTIAALLEQYESARDRNIYSAWVNGGKFEGKKVTDQDLLKWFKMRRSEYDKDDPEYDYWDQQHTQVDYQIGESKMLLRYEQGGIKEGGAAAWYTANAKRFPKNSEAWREAMRNAARFHKAAQEARKTEVSMSDSEKYQRANDSIYNQRIAPAIAAIEAWEDALDRKGLSDSGNSFMDVGADAMTQDEQMRTFMRSKKGRMYARSYQNATGQKFTYQTFRNVLRRAEQGYRQQAANAKKFGYQSYVPGINAQAAGIADYTSQLNIFTGDVYDDYTKEIESFDRQMAAAENAAERQAVRDRFKGRFGKIANRAAKLGDHVLAGAIDTTQNAIDTGKIQNRNELREGKSGMSTRNANTEPGFTTVKFEDGRVVETSDLNFAGLGTQEMIAAQTISDVERLEGYKTGEWIFVRAPDGSLIEQKTQNFKDYYNYNPGSSNRDNDFVQNDVDIRMPDGSVVSVPVMLQVQNVSITFADRGSVKVPGVFTYKTIDGDTRYQFRGPEGRMQDTAALPIDWVNNYDDGDRRTKAGFWFDETTGKIVPIATDADEMGNISINGSFVDMMVVKAQAEWLVPTRDKDGKLVDRSAKGSIPMPDTFFNAFMANEVQKVGPRTETGGYAAGGALTEAVQTENPEFRERSAPAVTRKSYPAAVSYLAGGKDRYDMMSDEEKAAVRKNAARLANGGGRLNDDLQQIVNEREQQGLVYEGNTFMSGEKTPVGETPPASQEAIDPVSGIDTSTLTEDEKRGLQLMGAAATDVTREQLDTAASFVRQQGLANPENTALWDDPENVTAWAEGLTGFMGDMKFVRPEDAEQPGDVPTVADDVRERVAGLPSVTTPMATLEKLIVLPAVLTEAGSTVDTSGMLAQYQSRGGRMRLAKMPAEARLAKAQEIAAEDSQADNLAYVYALAGELDILAAAGEAGLSEAEYYNLTGSLSNDERFSALKRNRDLRQASPDNLTSTSLLEDTLLNDLRAADWSESQLEAKFPEMYKAERETKPPPEPETGSILPGPFTAPGNYSFEGPVATGSTSAAPKAPEPASLSLRNALKGLQMVGINALQQAPKALAESTANPAMTLPPVRTVKPLTTAGPSITPSPSPGPSPQPSPTSKPPAATPLPSSRPYDY